jgi:hypothetical protein
MWEGRLLREYPRNDGREVGCAGALGLPTAEAVTSAALSSGTGRNVESGVTPGAADVGGSYVCGAVVWYGAERGVRRHAGHIGDT